MPILEPLIWFLKTLGYQVSVVKYRGHFGDKTPLDNVSLANLREDATRHIKKIEGKVVLLGLSIGAVIAHELARQFPAKVGAVLMYGTPMISKMPVPLTLLTIVWNWKKYLVPIVTAKGTVTLRREHIEDWLYEGFSSQRGAAEVANQPASALLLREILTGDVHPDEYSTIPHCVITCDHEKFHWNWFAKCFARKQGSKVGITCQYVEVPGGHFSALFKHTLMNVIKDFLEKIAFTK